MPRAKVGSVGAEVLEEYRRKGVESAILDLRLAYMEGFKLQTSYLDPLADSEAIFPQALPTQKTMRWSWSEPNITTIPEEYRDIVIPDADEYWLCWDWDAIEGRIAACYTHDPDELASYRRGDDIHTVNVCRMMHWELPPDLVDPHTSPTCAAWRAQHSWEGKGDRRRHVAKVIKYALQYARKFTAVLESKEIGALGFTRVELLSTAKAYWKAKVHLLAWKKAGWARIWRDHMARTRQGLRRPLMGDVADVEKQGLNHEIQGDVALEMNRTLLAIHDRWPESSLAWQSHDGAVIRFPVGAVAPWPELKTLVEYTATIAGETMTFTASWKVVPPGGGPSVHPDQWFGDHP